MFIWFPVRNSYNELTNETTNDADDPKPALSGISDYIPINIELVILSPYNFKKTIIANIVLS